MTHFYYLLFSILILKCNYLFLFKFERLTLSFDLQIDNDGLSYYYGQDATPDAYFREDFELDLDDEKYSKVEVPDFKNGRMGRFIHEFESVNIQ